MFSADAARSLEATLRRDRVRGDLERRVNVATMFSVFAAMALVLAAVGL